MPSTTAIYVRISRDREGDALGVERQRRECEALCATNGWAVTSVYSDNDISAYSGKPRPEYRRMLAAVAAGTVRRIVAWSPDRLHRSMTELEEFIALVEQHRVKIDTVQAGQWDLGTAAGRMVARQLGSVARYESENRSARVRSKLAQNAELGQAHGRRAFGWDRYRDDENRSRERINEAEARLIREGTARIVGGDSLSAVAKVFAGSGINPPGGKVWHKASVRSILMRPRNAGLRRHLGEFIGKGTWDPIISEGEFVQLLAVLRDPARRTSTDTAARHLLSGIARCGPCGAVIHAAQNRTVESYRCAAKGCVSRNRRDVDEYVSQLVITYLEAQEIGELLGEDRATEAELAGAELEQLRARLDLAADDYADGKIDGRQLARITARMRPTIASAEARAAASTDGAAMATMVLSGDVAAAWATAPVTHRRAVVTSLLDVQILRAHHGQRSFDPAAIALHWK